MTLTLTLREAPAAPVRAEALRPDKLAGLSRADIERLELWHGNRPAAVGELFAVSGDGGREVRVEGDLTRVAGLGAGMAGGRLTVAGRAGPHVGAGMRDGELIVEGDAGDWAGAEMRGGRLVVRGSAGRRLGGAYAGSRAGMRGGEILLHGDTGEEAAAACAAGSSPSPGASARPPARARSPARSSPSGRSAPTRARACVARASSR